ncbi:MAG: tetraacyldisaccharide 4'-kinase [Thermodesulfovibrionales bacterium]|jgi:tetraacyldisaccharide 4'-kinase
MGLLEFIYYIGYSFKKSRSLRNQKRLPRMVVSVGNITTGGTGKTPAVIALAEEAKKRGYQPCILTRGYKGNARGPCFISKGNGPLLSASDAGDEPALMAERLKGVPIVKGTDRYGAGMFALQHVNDPALFFILDDGFQHWKLYRDTDILLIDSTNPFGNGKLLPLGRLREPLREMTRADVIVLTNHSRRSSGEEESSAVSRFDTLINKVRDDNPDAPLFIAEHLPVSLKTLSGVELSLDTLAGKAVFAFCGIGNPASFKDSLLRINAIVRGFEAFGDHSSYGPHDIARIHENAKRCAANWIVTTEKDIMKMKGFSLPENLVSLRIDFAVDSRFYERVFREA